MLIPNPVEEISEFIFIFEIHYKQKKK